jgi:hypothetical protein
MIDPAHTEREYVLASHTNEAIRIVRRGGTVYKFLRPLELLSGILAPARVRQMHLRVRESRRWPEFNPLTFDEPRNCIISRFVDGRLPTRAEIHELRERLAVSGRGHIEDLSRHNVVMVLDRPIVIDFAVNEHHPDFHCSESDSQRT